MPRVYLTKQEKLNNELSAWVYGQMKVRNISQCKMADVIGIKQPSLNYKLKHGCFTYQDLTAIFSELEPDAETLQRLMGVEK